MCEPSVVFGLILASLDVARLRALSQQSAGGFHSIRDSADTGSTAAVLPPYRIPTTNLNPTSYSERRPAAPPLPVPPAASRTIHSTTSGAMREKSEAARTLHSAQIHPGRCNLAQVRLHVADADVGDIVGRGVDGQREYMSFGRG